MTGCNSRVHHGFHSYFCERVMTPNDLKYQRVKEFTCWRRRTWENGNRTFWQRAQMAIWAMEGNEYWEKYPFPTIPITLNTYCRVSSNRNGQKNRKIGIHAPKKEEKNRNSPLKIGKKYEFTLNILHNKMAPHSHPLPPHQTRWVTKITLDFINLF